MPFELYTWNGMTDVFQPDAPALALAQVMAALSDPSRLAIVAELHDRGEVPCGTLHLDVVKSTRSHHLKVLREAGVTWTRIDGVERFVKLRYACLEERFPGLLASVLAAQATAR